MKKRKRVVVRLARMDDDRQITPPRFLKLLAEKLQLRLARLGRVVVVKADFTNRRLRREGRGKREKGRGI